MYGDHAVKLNGRTYHFLPTSVPGVGPSGGLSYFLYDSRSALAGHASSRSRTNSKGAVVDAMDATLLKLIYDDMRINNDMAKDIADFGESEHLSALLDGTVDMNMPRAIAQVRMCINTCAFFSS
jgi:hypothetical protein